MTRFASIFWVVLCLSIASLTQCAVAEPGIRGRDVVASDLFLDELPDCAVSCYATAKTNSSCKSWAEDCVCLNATLKSSILGCASTACPHIQQYQTQNVMDTLCDITERNLDAMTQLICWAGLLVTGVFVLLRMLSKVLLADHHSPPLAYFTLDDALTMTAYLLSLLCYFIVAFKLVDSGLGRDQWTLTPQQVIAFSYWLYVMEPIYLAAIWCIKTSFLCLFIRLFATGQTERFCLRGRLSLRHALWGTAIANTLCISSFIITFIFQCTPISFTWMRWQGQAEGTCINLNVAICAHGALGIAFDIWILYLPMSQLPSMHLPGRKKVQVGLMLGIGAIATLVSFLRLQGLVAYAASPNATWENYGGTAWSLVEVSIGIICTCLPAARILVLRVTSEAWRRIRSKPPRPISTQTHATFWSQSTSRPASASRPTSVQTRLSCISELRSEVQRPTPAVSRHCSTKKSFETDIKNDSTSSTHRPSVADCLVEKFASSKEEPTFSEAIGALSVALGRVPDGRPAGQVNEKESTLALSGDGGRLDRHPSAAAAPSEPDPVLVRRRTPDYFSIRVSRRAAGPAAMAAAKQRALGSPSEEPEKPQQGEEQESVDPVPTPPIPAKLGTAIALSTTEPAEGPAGLRPTRPLPARTASGSTVKGIYEPQQTVAPRQQMDPAAHICLPPLPPTQGWATFGVAEPDSPGSSLDRQEVRAHSPLED
ncbi:hypothetical protein RB595_010651 [Gaeumannomyces hyphopodioides]